MGTQFITVAPILIFSLYLSVALSPAAAYTGSTTFRPRAYSNAPSPSPTTSTSPSTFVTSPSPSPSPSYSSVMFTLQDDVDRNLYAVPRDEQARDSRYLTAHMTAAVKHVEGFVEEEVVTKLKNKAIPKSEKECLDVCKEVYEDAAESMKRGMESVSAGDFIKASFDVSSFNTDVDTCNDCTKAFKEFDQWAKGVAGDCLDKIDKHTHGF